MVSLTVHWLLYRLGDFDREAHVQPVPARDISDGALLR